MTIDPRLAERRKAVAEDRAQRNVGRALKMMLLAAFISAAVWLVFSPYLSVKQVRTAGIVRSDAYSILAEHSIAAGTPMIMIRSQSAETALLEDPWIRDARVYLNWPDEAIVRVTERQPIVWMETSNGWSRHAADGALVPSTAIPDDSLPQVRLPHVQSEDAANSAMVRGAAEFFASFGPMHSQPALMRLQDGELWVSVGGHEVRLGRPVDMEAKARVLEVMLGEDLAPGSTIVLIASSNPAVGPSDGTSQGGLATRSGGEFVGAGQH